MKILREHIIVKVPSVFIDESRYKGVDGKTILLNVTYHPERHIRNYGIVVSTPDFLFRFPLASNHTGAPNYHDNQRFEWKTTEDIELEIKDNDLAYFHYNCLLPDQQGQGWNHLYITSQVENGKQWHYFRVKYDLVFGVVRYEPRNAATKAWDWKNESLITKLNIPGVEEERYSFTDLSGNDQMYQKKVIPIGSYVFVEPDKETWESISIPVPETINGKIIVNIDGSPKMKPKSEWIVTKQEPGDVYLRGWVRYTGTPLKGDREFLQAGMYISFQRHTNTKVLFEGREYFRMRQRHVVAIESHKSKQYESV